MQDSGGPQDQTRISSNTGAVNKHSRSSSGNNREQQRGKQLRQGDVSLQVHDYSDSDDDISRYQGAVRVVSPGRIESGAVSINTDPQDITFPGRPRSRIWEVVGSLGREKSVHHDHARTPHRCQSNVDVMRRVEHLLAQGDDYSETEPLLSEVCEKCEHVKTKTSRGASPNVSNLRRSHPASVCSTSDLSAPFTSRRHISASVDDLTSSTDSHCHSNIKKGGFDKKARTRLILASILCLMFMTGEMVGGLLAHSLAIISDAAHLLTDFASFMISLMALYLAHRPATKKLSFGWYRIEILGAFVSILMLWVLTGILVYSAVLRIMEDDYEIDATVMLITAATGVAFNIVLGTTLHQHSHSHGGHGHSHGAASNFHGKPQTDSSKAAEESQVISPSNGHSYGSLHNVEAGERSDSDHEGHGHSHIDKPSNINVKAAFIHVLGDLFQSVGVLVAAFIIFYKPEWKIADPICTFLFSLFVLITTITIMRDILVVLMEGTPRGINFTEVRNTFFEVEGVLDIHNLRVWSLTMDKIALSVHLAIDKESDPHKVLKSASVAIQRKFNISETTMQIEEYVTEMMECQDCQGPKH